GNRWDSAVSVSGGVGGIFKIVEIGKVGWIWRNCLDYGIWWMRWAEAHPTAHPTARHLTHPPYAFILRLPIYRHSREGGNLVRSVSVISDKFLLLFISRSPLSWE
ncbi:TPA: hypothetical protein ACFNMU_002069, partial [Neisseria lactamica]